MGGRARPLPASDTNVDMGVYELYADGALPVELATVTAMGTPEGVLLSWTTRSEINNLGFHVHRSDTPEGGYTLVTSVLIPGYGTDSTPHEYAYLDESAVAGETYWYVIEDVDFTGIVHRSQPYQVAFGHGELRGSVPTRSALLPNYPNPFNPETWIPYDLAEDASVEISIHMLDGRRVRTLVHGNQSAGSYRTKLRAAYWDGRDATGERVASGTYFYHLRAGDFQATRKMLILK